MQNEILGHYWPSGKGAGHLEVLRRNDSSYRVSRSIECFPADFYLRIFCVPEAHHSHNRLQATLITYYNETTCGFGTDRGP